MNSIVDNNPIIIVLNYIKSVEVIENSIGYYLLPNDILKCTIPVDWTYCDSLHILVYGETHVMRVQREDWVQ